MHSRVAVPTSQSGISKGDLKLRGNSLPTRTKGWGEDKKVKNTFSTKFMSWHKLYFDLETTMVEIYDCTLHDCIFVSLVGFASGKNFGNWVYQYQSKGKEPVCRGVEADKRR